jgi:PHD/YefM family antitoxin component YafN of YafNO toxin-antitoxin module
LVTIEDIYSLTEFQRKTREHILRLKESGRPHVLTVNGKAELVVQDAKAYEAMLAVVDRAEAIIGIQKGLESMRKGKGRDAFEALEEIRSRREPEAGT